MAEISKLRQIAEHAEGKHVSTFIGIAAWLYQPRGMRAALLECREREARQAAELKVIELELRSIRDDLVSLRAAGEAP
jgi:hypothetical protein